MLDLREEYINENSLKEETICGFKVSSEMKRFWAAEQKVLAEIIRICEKYDITYYADYGTLLGAIRHNGFIPWDDDIDICLKRNDYMKLLQILPKELPKNYNINNCYTNINNDLHWTTIFNYRSVPIPNEIQRQFFNCPYAAGVDIFVLDYIPRDKELANIIINLYTTVYNICKKFEEFKYNGELEQYVQQVEYLCKVKLVRNSTLKNQLFILEDKIASMFTEQESDHLGCLAHIVVSDLEAQYPKQWFDNIIKKDFNGLKINIPIGYDEILTSYYGNYMTPSSIGMGHDYPVYKKQKLYLNSIKQL